MPTKDELIDMNAELTAEVARLRAERDEGLDTMPQDAAGADLVAGLLYTVELVPRVEGGATFRLHAAGAPTPRTEEAPVLIDSDGVPLVHGKLYEFDSDLGLLEFEPGADQPDARAEGAAKEGIGALGEDDGVERWLYVEGEGFSRVSDGVTIKLERWKVDQGDGTQTEPREGKVYRYAGGVTLVEVQPGDESDLARKVEELEADRLRAGTTIDELREANSALSRRVNAPLHGSIDALKPVV